MGVPLVQICGECGKEIRNGANGISAHFAGEDPHESRELIDKVCPAMVCRAAAIAIDNAKHGFPGLTGQEKKTARERLPAIKATYRRLQGEAKSEGRTLVLTPAPVV